MSISQFTHSKKCFRAITFYRVTCIEMILHTIVVHDPVVVVAPGIVLVPLGHV